MQLWQQNMTYKQLQELQRQQQLHQLDEERQQNAMNQHAAAGQQAAEGPLPLFINGTPVRDAPYSLMNLMQRGPSPSPQGFPNRQAFPPEQHQNMRSMSLMPQQLHGSLHGTPVGSAGGNESQYSNLKGMSRDSMSFLSHAGGNGSQPPIIHSSTFGNSFPRNHGVSMDNVNASGGGFLSGQGFQMKNDFGQVPLSHENFLQMNSSLPEFNSRQDLTGNSEVMHQSTTQLGLSQSLVPLDPLEQKILFNMDDDGWDTGFGRSIEAEAGGFGSALEQSNFSSAFQSGSWSALMQSAVAEASNTDTGAQENHSGLTFQNAELSTNNPPPNFINEERQQTGWVDNNLQSAPSSSKSFPMFNDSSMKSNFPGFQQSDFRSSNQQGEGPRQYDFNESFQRSPRNAGEWLDCNPQQSNQISQQIEPLKQFENSWAGHNYDHSERDAQQRRMTSHNNIGEQFNKQKGDANGAMYKERDRWPGQLEQQNSQNDNSMRKDSQAVHFGSVQKAATSKAQLEVGKRTQENPDYTKHFVNNYENDIGGKVQQQRRTSPQNFGNSYEGASKSFENFNDSYNSKGFSGPKQGLGGQFSIVGNNSKNAMHSDKKCLPNFQGNSKALDNAVYGGDLGSSASTTFGRPAGSDRQNAALQTSVHMLDLLHKVDQSREDGPMARFGSTNQNSLSEMPKANTHVDQFDQSSASHGFGLKLAPPAQRLPNSNCFPSAQDLQISNNLNPSQANSESGFKNQGWLNSTSSARSLPPNQFSQRAHQVQDDTSTNLGQTRVSSYMNMHANSDATLTSGSPHFGNQPPVQHMHNARVVGESSQATQAGTSGRFVPFNHVSSQDTSQQTSTNPGQPFPILETSISRPSVMSNMSQKSGMLGTHQNAWKNVPTSQFPSAFSSMDPSKNSIEEPSRSSQGGLNDQISQKGRMISQDLGVSSVNSQGSEYGEELPQKQRSRHEISSELQDSSQIGGFFDGQETAMKHTPAHSNQDPDSLHGENNGSAASKRNLESFDRLLKPSQTVDKNGTLLHQIQAMKNSRETDSSKRHNEADVNKVPQVSDSAGKQSVSEHDLNFRNHTHCGPNPLQPGSSPSGDAKMLSFLSHAREELSGKSLSQPTTQPSPQSGKFNQNGQTLQTYDASPAKTAMEQFSAGKASQNIPINTSVDQISAAVSRQVGSILPSPTASLVASENFPAPHVLPSDLANQSGDNIKIKKRKTKKYPWHVEVTQGSDRLQDISMAEQEWARATNYLVEKVEDDIESIGEVHQIQHRPKRRLILTTRLMQNILRPASASILLGDASSRCDSVPYFVAKLALGDACSLANCSINEPHAASDNKDMTSEKYKAFDSDKHLTNVMEGFTERAKKLENDFSRLESPSILDIRLDYQDLERNRVINRFAKFHMRGQAITSGTSHSGTTMTALLPGPQRYVTAFPMPRELPEGSQCFSM